MSVSVVGAMIMRGGCVLLGLRAPHKRICPGLWDFIGGHVEPGETALEALSRELLEEVDITDIEARPVAVIDFSAEAGRLVHYQLFAVERFRGEPRLANDEHTQLQWLPYGAAAGLLDLASGKYRRFLRALGADPPVMRI